MNIYKASTLFNYLLAVKIYVPVHFHIDYNKIINNAIKPPRMTLFIPIKAANSHLKLGNLSKIGAYFHSAT